MAIKYFGHPPGVAVGATFPSRAALRAAGVHAPNMQGIHGTQADGADSIVVSGGYVDDEDHGDVIVDTGAGGNDPDTKRQIADQRIDHWNNAGLITSELAGHPVRVTRKIHGTFRYDGLFSVAAHWVDVGRDGFKIVRFRLEKLEDAHPEGGPAVAAADAGPSYATTTVTRRIRDSAASRQVKEWHDHACQVCGAVLTVDGGRPYSEGAHIRPLGRPHIGPDDTANILCLCPTHHVQFDKGGIGIRPDLTVVDRTSGAVIGHLRTQPVHRIDKAHLTYVQKHVFPTA